MGFFYLKLVFYYIFGRIIL